MIRVVVAVDAPRGAHLSTELELEGVEVAATVPAQDAATATVHGAPFDVLILQTSARTLTADLVAQCDARGVRIHPLCEDDAGRRLAERFGLAAPLPPGVDGWVLAEALTAPARPRAAAPPQSGRVITVWGPHGAPGRSTLAVELSIELARGGRHVGLVDADSHAPSLALSLGLADEGPGFAAACRQAERGGLDATELRRISVPVSAAGGTVDVLTGLNRPGRWPELSEARVGAVLNTCRTWAEATVVDVAASLERDEEIVSDLDGPRRNAATLAALGAADLVVAVCGADPVGVARFLRAYAELRATIGAAPVAVVVNRLRAGTLGFDARGQVRHALERFAGIEEAWFVPLDPRSADAAMLAARPVTDIAPRSPLAAAVRRFAAEAVTPSPSPGTRRRSRGRGVPRRSLRTA